MTQDEIIRMAREAGAIKRYWGDNKEGFAFENDDQLERFAAIVAAHERERMWCDAEFARQQEREACAKVCEDLIAKGYQLEGELDLCAAAIRAR